MVKLRVRARAVDMLGRQQIAGIPTALHELLKNAHDAYAERAEIDYFRRTGILVLRDDGLGMTRDEVENRWLTIGTESRVGANQKRNSWTGPKRLPIRAIMGEKGIGRLSIAAIAPITLLMTRAVRPNGLHNMVVALVHWALFEQPGLDISSIDVPILEFPDGKLPTQSDIGIMVGLVQKNLQGLQEFLDPEEVQKIDDQLERLKIAPDKMDYVLNHDRIEPLSLTSEGYGTTFVMLPTVPELNDDIDGGSDNDSSQLEKMLIGFSNSMTTEKPSLSVAFRDHGWDGRTIDHIGEQKFFSHEDLEIHDHHIEGNFDEFGQFHGKVSIFKKKPLEFICNWPKGRGKKIKCGPFKINFYYVMGTHFESTVAQVNHKKFLKKLDRFGGLYIYRDNIRILPYGEADYDFLGIEKRRSKSAQDWFFSYRRIFGYISLTQEENANLSEKAGREGFRQNQAYRDFRSLLVNLFERLALEYFRPNSPQAELYWDEKEKFRKALDTIKQQKRISKSRINHIKVSLDSFFYKYNNGYFENRHLKIRNDIESRISNLKSVHNSDQVFTSIRQLESDLKKDLFEFEKDLSVESTHGLILNKRTESDWQAYQEISQKLRKIYIFDFRNHIREKIRDMTKGVVDISQHRVAAVSDLSNNKDQIIKDLLKTKREIYKSADKMKETLKRELDTEFSEIRSQLEKNIGDFTKQTKDDPTNLNKIRVSFEEKLSELRTNKASFLNTIQKSIEELNSDIKEGLTFNDRLTFFEQEVYRLEEKLELYQDFAHIGMSVSILQHEFSHTVQSLRKSVRDMRPWAQGTPKLLPIYQRFRHAFDELDGYLNVLDPLGRRSRRTKVDLSGDQIRAYIRDIFGARFDKENIKLISSDSFNDRSVTCHSSALLGAFVNIVDNASYWVVQGAVNERKIELDTDEKGFLISNTGPGIEERHSKRIFEFGESMKLRGRGMGLPIAQDALKREGFLLELIQFGHNVKPVFRITTELIKEDSDDGTSKRE